MMDQHCAWRFCEFFAGGGMARIGLGAAWKCVFANDIHPKKAASYRENFGGRELQVDDIAALTTKSLPEEAELAWASFPCQDLSLAGAGAGLKGERSGTFWLFWRLMKASARGTTCPDNRPGECLWNAVGARRRGFRSYWVRNNGCRLQVWCARY